MTNRLGATGFASALRDPLREARTGRASGTQKWTTLLSDSVVALTGASDQDFLDDLTVHIGQTPLEPIVVESEPLVVDAKQVQDRCVQVM